MHLRRIDVTSSFQPLPFQDETFLDVQDQVGLYEGYDLLIEAPHAVS